MNILDCKHFKEMVVSAANNLTNNKEVVDKLNVFPVPDGDTGTNMNMTFTSGVNAVVNYANDFVGDSAKFLSKNMLMGARGNSGVILSQVFKGFAKGVEGLQSITVRQFIDGLLNGAKVAYKAVMRPVEGTILTVVRETTDYGNHYVNTHPDCSFQELVDFMVKEAKASLDRTPELLPVLKEAGVVDSGAAGFVYILEGFAAYFQGNPIALKGESKVEEHKVEEGFNISVTFETEGTTLNERLTNSLGKICNDIDLTNQGNIHTLKARTLNPLEVLKSINYNGTFINICAVNNSYENKEACEAKEKSKYALVSVCNGEGIKDKFIELGVDHIIFGGQTMNPATEDFVKIINEANAENIIILPNNSNIILAANQAKDICSEHNVVVLPTKSIPQGLSACLNFSRELEVQDNINNMNEAINAIHSISITTAIKDTSYNSLEIHLNDYIGMVDKDIVISNPDLTTVAYHVIDMIAKEEAYYLTLIVGNQTTVEFAQAVLDYGASNYDMEGEIIVGKQDLYPLIIGAE